MSDSLEDLMRGTTTTQPAEESVMEENAQVNTEPALDAVEKESYSPASYKMVKNIRDRGKLRGVNVPYLTKPVKRPEKPRLMFLILEILASIAFAAVIGLIVYLAFTMLYPMIAQTLGLSADLTTQQSWDIFGLGSMAGGMVSIVFWGLIIFLVGIAIAVIAYFISLIKKMNYFKSASVQEMAVGHKLLNMIISTIMVVVVVIAIAIAMSVMIENIPTKGLLVIWGIAGVLAIIFGVFAAALIMEKVKAKKEFKTFSQEEQDDFLAHAKALQRADHTRKIRNTEDIILSGEF